MDAAFMGGAARQALRNCCIRHSLRFEQTLEEEKQAHEEPTEPAKEMNPQPDAATEAEEEGHKSRRKSPRRVAGSLPAHLGVKSIIRTSFATQSDRSILWIVVCSAWVVPHWV